MNLFDMVLAAIICFCMIRGIFRGLVKELASIFGVLAGFYAAYTYYPYIFIPFISNRISDPGYQNILNFVVLFCFVFLAVSLLGVVIKYILNIAYLGWVDRICGFGFGLIKGVLITSILLIMFTTFLPSGSNIIKNSLLSPHITRISENLAKVIKQEMKLDFEKKIKELKKMWEESKYPFKTKAS